MKSQKITILKIILFSILMLVSKSVSAGHAMPQTLNGLVLINVVYIDKATEGWHWDATGMKAAKNNVIAVQNWMESEHPDDLPVNVIVKEYGPITVPDNTNFHYDADDVVKKLTYTSGGVEYNYASLVDFNNRTQKKANADKIFTYFMINDVGQSDANYATKTIRMYYYDPSWYLPNSYELYLHEALHIFGALDEYLTVDGVSTGSPCGQEGPWGYINSDYNCNCWNATFLYNTIMKCTSFCSAWASPTTRGMIGWGDRDDDGVFDVHDYCPDDAGGSGSIGACRGCPPISCDNDCDHPICDDDILTPYCGTTCLAKLEDLMAGEHCKDANICSDYYEDWDEDTYGNSEVYDRIPDDKVPSGWVLDSTDCDDYNSSINPGAPETCDGLDNNCDGNIDEGLTTQEIICGEGECRTTGTAECVDGTLVEACTPLLPTNEICDGLDNDCNGVVDNSITSEPTLCGIGECATSGALECTEGVLVDSCTPGVPSLEICDGLDNDCNGMDDFLGYDGSESDDDEDGKFLCNDNCPLISNPDQIDVDSDGEGDVCDACPNDPLNDFDADGVCGDKDSCLDTAPGETVNATGCSITDLCPPDKVWRNHGQYVRCVARTSKSFMKDGLISQHDRKAIVRDAAKSSIGRKEKK